MRLWHALSYRKHLIVASTVVCVALGIAYYIAAPRYYRSTAELMISERKADELTSMGEQIANANLMANQQKLVLSPVVIGNALADLPEQYLVDLARVPRRDWVEDLSSRLSATVSRKGSLVEVSYRSRDPETASAIVSRIVSSYLSFVDEMHEGSAGETIKVNSDQLKTTEAEIQKKQRDLVTLRGRVGHLSIGDQNDAVDPIVQRALKMNESWIASQQRRLELTAQLQAVDVSIAKGKDLRQHLMSLEKTLGQQMLVSSLGMSAEDISSIRAREAERVEAEREMRSLEPYLGPNNPRMQELVAKIEGINQYLNNYGATARRRMAGMTGSELGAMLRNLLQQSLNQARFEEEENRKAFLAAREEASKQSTDLVMLRTAERDLVRLEGYRDTLIEQIATANSYLSQGPIQAVVVKDPLPEVKPISPRLKSVLALSLVGGLVIGVALVYVQDALDDRFNTPEELSGQLGVPVLALIQRLTPLPGDGLRSLHTHEMPNAAESEAFRTLRTSLALNSEVTDRILVSSAEPGDGKTTVLANLAVAFAQAGKRTLVIDADLRRPGMTALLGLKGRQGVIDILSSSKPPAEFAPQHALNTDSPGLDIIPAGLRRPNPAELLASEAFIELLAWADSQYDQVLVDCPPVLAVSDAQIVGRLVDGAILVVRPDKNHRRLVTRACESFLATGSQVLGVVANDVSEFHGAGYGYGYGYSYHSQDEEDSNVATSDCGTRRAA